MAARHRESSSRRKETPRRTSRHRDDIFGVGPAERNAASSPPTGPSRYSSKASGRSAKKRFSRKHDAFFVRRRRGRSRRWQGGSKSTRCWARCRRIRVVREADTKSARSSHDRAGPSRTAACGHPVAHLPTIKARRRQQLLEMEDASKSLERLHELMPGRDEILKSRRRSGRAPDADGRRTAKRNYLNEQLQASEGNWAGARDEFKTRSRDRGDPKTRKRLSKEGSAKVKRAQKAQMMHPRAQNVDRVRNYIEWIHQPSLVDKSEEKYDRKNAEEILARITRGLKKDQRTHSRLSGPLRRSRRSSKSRLACSVPPGGRQNSRANSLTRATGRKFVRGRWAASRRSRDCERPPAKYMRRGCTRK